MCKLFAIFLLLFFIVNNACAYACETGEPSQITQCSPSSRWSMPLTTLGEKHYYFGIFFPLNWYKAAQYCRYHGMDLASFSTLEENNVVVNHLTSLNLGIKVFWLSAIDKVEEGKYVWMGTGRPVTYSDWRVGEGNNHNNGKETEDCLALYNPDGAGFKWADGLCSLQYHFICELQQTF